MNLRVRQPMRIWKAIKYVVRREFRETMRPPRTEEELWWWAIK